MEETVFCIGGEGGCIDIYREKVGRKYQYIYHHNEFDPTGEGLDVNKTIVYNDFNTAFNMLAVRYPIHNLYPLEVHSDIKARLIDWFVAMLNRKQVKTDFWGQKDWEEKLGIRFIFDKYLNKWIVEINQFEK